MTSLAFPALWLAATIVLIAREYRLYRQHRLDAEQRLRGNRQERETANTLRPRTGQVAAAPRLVPLADVLPFPDRDQDSAA